MLKKIPNITFKSLLQPIKNIKKRNAYFDYLSDEGKRLEIAWDSLQLILLGVIRTDSIYWSPQLYILRSETKSEYKDDYVNAETFQSRLCDLKEIQNCRVCARGSMLLSQIRLGNHVEPSSCSILSGGDGSIVQGFTMDDYNAMEANFESYIESSSYGGNTDYPKWSQERLMNICCNILINGNYTPKDTTDYLIDNPDYKEEE